MIAVGYHIKKNKNQDKWNHFNHITMQSLLGAYRSLPLSHMAKSYIWLEETQPHISRILIKMQEC